MEYDYKLFYILLNGWGMPETAIDWSRLTEEQLNNYCSIVIKNGIEPMLKVLGIKLTEEIPTDKIIVLDADHFAKLYGPRITEVGYSACDIESLENGRFSNEIIENIYKGFKEKNNGELADFDACLSDLTCIQGFAFEGYSFINSNAAFKGIGLHLICHELMHTIANKSAVGILRANDTMGDEDVNEYFARLASQYLLCSNIVDKKTIGGTTNIDMKNAKEGEHNGFGTYGKRIQKRGWYANMNFECLKELADFYFNGNHTIDDINKKFIGSQTIPDE